jgi:hypothetical protein
VTANRGRRAPVCIGRRAVAGLGRQWHRFAAWTTGRSPLAAGAGGAGADPSDMVTELDPGRSFTWVATRQGGRTTARNLREETRHWQRAHDAGGK